MKNEQFDSWLKNQSDKNSGTFDSELEWQLLEPKLPKKKKDRRYFFIIFFAGVLGLGIVSHFYYKNNSNSVTSSLSYKKENINHRIETKAIDNNIQKSNTNLMAIESPLKDHSISRSTSQTNTSKPTISLQNNELLSSSKLKQHIITSSKQEDYKALNNQNESAHQLSENIQNQNSEKITIPEKIELENLVPKLSLITISTNNKVINQFTNNKIIKRNKISFAAFIQSQYGILNQSISGTKEIANLRNQSENGIDRFAIFSGMQAVYKNKYFLRSGFEIGVTTIQFKHQYYDTSIIQTQQETLSVTTHEDLSQTYEIGTNTKEQIRLINKNKYNHRRQFTLPILLGYSTNLTSRIGMQYSGGVIIPLFQSFEGEIIANTSNKLNYYGSGVKNFFGPCSVQLGLEVVYHVFKGINIYSGVNYRQETRSWLDVSNNTNEIHRSCSVSLGINYKVR